MIEPTDLHALADNELSAEQRQTLMAKLATDQKSTDEYQSILAMKALLQSKTEEPDVDDLWNRCRDRIAEIDKTRRVESFVGRYAWGICGVFFLAIMVGGVFNRTSVRSVKPNDMAAVIAGMSPASVSRSQNQAELNDDLRQVVGEAFKARPARMVVTALGQNPTPGSRSSYVQLSDEFGSVAVVALYDTAQVDGVYEYEPDPKYRYTKVNGLPALFWAREDGVICMVIGQRSYEELHGIVKAMCSGR